MSEAINIFEVNGTLDTAGLAEEFARNRQTFLTEQGYRYTIRDAADVFKEAEPEV